MTRQARSDRILPSDSPSNRVQRSPFGRTAAARRRARAAFETRSGSPRPAGPPRAESPSSSTPGDKQAGCHEDPHRKREQTGHKTNGPPASGRKVSTSREPACRFLAGHESCVGRRRVRKLEARFHPSSKSSDAFVVVGRVVCTQHRATIELAEIPPSAVKPFDSVRLRDKLEFLVMSVAGDPCRSLLALRSGFWSFVELSASGTDRGGV